VIGLLSAVSVLVVVYLLSGRHPLLAGVAAVVPVKMLYAGVVTWGGGGRESLRACVEGMFAGQIVWAIILAAIWLWLRSVP
jgi:uncharacterized membrane protein (GlpM family)